MKIPKILSIFFGLSIALVAIEPVHATIFNCPAGDVGCLIGAINTANANGEADAINLEDGTYTLSEINNITEGPNGLPSITSQININGNDAIIERESSVPSFRILHVIPEGSLRLNRVTITGGDAGEPRPYGGGIFNEGKLMLERCKVSGNSAQAVGGIDSFGTLNARKSTINGNISRGTGGGIRILGEAILRDCTVSENRSERASGGGITITNGFINDVFVIGNAMLKNCTVSGNMADRDGGGIVNSGKLTMTNCTIIDNDANQGGGIFTFSSTGTAELINSIVANNLSGGDCFGRITSLDYNLDSDGTCNLTQPNDLPNNDPLLGEFADDGAPGRGHFPLIEGSPAIDKGDDAACSPTDQLGNSRVDGDEDGFIVCDIGAIEFQPPLKDLLYTPVPPCRIADTRESGGIIGASTQRDFYVYGSGNTISAQGGNSAGCPAPMDVPLAAHINMIAVNPTGKGNLQAFPVGAGTGAGLSVNYNTIDTNLANAGTVKTVIGSGPDITVASNFSSAHTVIDVLGYYYLDEGLLYTPVMPCRIVDTRYTSAGIIDANTERNFRVFGSGGTIFAQGGDPDGCPSPLGEPLAAHINMVAVYPYGKGNLQAFPVDARTGAGLSVNYNILDTNLANAGTVKSTEGAGADIAVASNFSSANTVIDVLGYYYPDGDLVFTPVTPCRIVDTRKTSAGIIDANTERNFSVFGSSGTISAQGGDSAGCSSPQGEPLAVHINMVAVNPIGKGNLQAFPLGAETGAGLSVNYNTIDTNLANAGTVKSVTGSGADITVASNFSSAHTVIDVLGYYYSAP